MTAGVAAGPEDAEEARGERAGARARAARARDAGTRGAVLHPTLRERARAGFRVRMLMLLQMLMLWPAWTALRMLYCGSPGEVWGEGGAE